LIAFGGDRRPATVPLVVWLLIAINVAVFVAELNAPDPSALIDAFAAVPYDITNGIVLAPPSPPSPLLTIVTAMFFHGGVAHIGFNMLFLFAFGPTIEATFGHVRFAAFYLLCGIAGEAAQIAVGPASHLPAIGASGAIAGVLGAYIVTYPTRWLAALVIGVWAATQFANGFGQLSAQVANDSPGVAYFIHIGGFCCGVLAAGLFRGPDAGKRASFW